MAIKVYILKKSIMKSSMDEYLEMKAELKERKKLEKQMNPEKQMDPESMMEQKQKKELRAVFVSESDTALQALEIAGISYEGEIDLDDIEFCKVESQQKCICGNLHIPVSDPHIFSQPRLNASADLQSPFSVPESPLPAFSAASPDLPVLSLSALHKHLHQTSDSP